MLAGPATGLFLLRQITGIGLQDDPIGTARPQANGKHGWSNKIMTARCRWIRVCTAKLLALRSRTVRAERQSRC